MTPGKDIARKDVPKRKFENPSQAHLREISTSNITSTWDIPEEGQKNRKRFHVGTGAGASAGWALSDRFDRMLPPHRRYLGRSRRTLIIALLVASISLLALIVGLAVGLSKKSE